MTIPSIIVKNHGYRATTLKPKSYTKKAKRQGGRNCEPAAQGNIALRRVA